jgi:D-Tyr-tRNAtyr deacylase
LEAFLSSFVGASVPVAPDQNAYRLLETRRELLMASQFNLHGGARKRRRALGVRVEESVFRVTMDVALVNEGPLTILLDSRKGF